MHNEFTAIIKGDNGWFVAYCPEIPEANGQGKTVAASRKNLAAAIALILKDRREHKKVGAKIFRPYLSFVNGLVKDRYTPYFRYRKYGRPAEDPEFMLRLCLLQYLYGDSDRQVIENAVVLQQ